MRLKPLLFFVALALAVMISAPKSFAQNLVQNGSFETGDFTSWNVNGLEEVVTGPFSVYQGAQDGLYYSVWGNVGSPGSISQTIADQAGTQYTLSFWFAANGDNPSSFSVSWDNNVLLDLTNPSTGGAWNQYSFNVTGTGSDTLTFTGQDDPAWMALDNISVSAAGATGTTPEPSSFLLLGSGLLAAAGVVRRKLSR